MSEQFDYVVNTALGMEDMLVAELTKLGAEKIEPMRAGVRCRGDLAFGYKACLHSRVANRVLLVLQSVSSRDAEDLYSGVQYIDWRKHLTPQHSLAVDFLMTRTGRGFNPNFSHTHFGGQKVKDAIVDQQRAHTGERSSIDGITPDLRINVFLHDQRATISIDLSGGSLHMRGYRALGTEAPLKENLAAAILMMSGWPREGYDLIDPMCGSGTLLIEAALMAKNVAPGLSRARFGFENWLMHDQELWMKLRSDAEAAIVRGRKNLPKISGSDIDPHAVTIAKSNCEKAGVADMIQLHVADFSKCAPSSEHGLLVINPPYGERLGELDELRVLYKEIGDVMKTRFKGWEGYIFTSSAELAKSVGLKCARRFVMYNGPLECRLLKYELY